MHARLPASHVVDDADDDAQEERAVVVERVAVLHACLLLNE